MKKRKIIGRILLIFLLVWIMSGCGKEEVSKFEDTEDNELTNIKEEMVVAVNVDGSSGELPFENVWLNRSRFWGSLVFQGLLIADENISNVSPDLCEEYIISTDGTVYTFVLKDNLTWHDGEALTAEDVVWSFENYLKVQETNGFVKKGIHEILGAEEFENGQADIISGICVEGNNITFTLKKDNMNFLDAVAQVAILPKHCLEKVYPEEFDRCDFWKMPIGSGPYKVVENIDNKEAVLVLHREYSGKMPQIQRIRYKVLEHPQTDSFDFTISSDPVTVNKFKRNPNYNVIETNNLYYRYLIFNLDKRSGENNGLLKNPQVRKALMLAIDKERIVQEIYEGTAVTIDGGIPRGDSWYVEKERQDAEYNPVLAKHILTSSNFDFSKTIVLTRYNMDDLSVRLLEEIAQCWREIGISVEIVPVENDSTNKLFVEADWYDVALKNLSAADYTEWYYEYSSENLLWSEIMKERKEFDTMINYINHATFANELKFLYSEIQQLESSLMYKIPIAIVPQYVIYNKMYLHIPKMKFPNLWYYYDLDLSEWRITK